MMRKASSIWIVLLCLNFACGQESVGRSSEPLSPPLSLQPWVLHSKLIHEVIPEYPTSARENHLQGDVLVGVVVDQSGKVKKMNVIRSLDKVDCSKCFSALDDAAIEAVKKWEYQPTVVDGKPVMISSWVAFRFQLEPVSSVEILSRSESSTPQVVIGGTLSASQVIAPTPVPGTINPQRIKILASVGEDHLIHKIDPPYPQMAKVAHIQGNVVLRSVIDEEGNIAELQVLSGHPILVQSALEAVKQWKYRP
jgi:TonB family protein